MPRTSSVSGVCASAPHLSTHATVLELDDKQLWIRILNDAQQSGLSPAAVQETGQVCRGLIT